MPTIFSEGQTIAGRYRITRYLSRGGMGEVYEARDLELGEAIALKTLLPEIAGDEPMIVQFKQEISLSRRVAHPNVCRVFDLARHEATVFLTMEFLSGETLSEKVRRDGRMSAGEALPLLAQMGSALDAAHSAGVIHRDFKPSNVMLVSAAGGLRAVVTDFGLARRTVSSGAPTVTMSKHVIGTVDYMAPEVLTGGVATPASDLYALGLTAYKMVTGSLPFHADTPLAGAVMRLNRTIPSPRVSAPELDLNWERAILRAIETKPARRFARASEFVQALRGEERSGAAVPLLTGRHVAIAAMAVGAILGIWAGWKEFARYSQRLPAAAQDLYQKGSADISAGAYFAATKALAEAARLAPRVSQIHARLAEAWIELDLPEKAGEEMLLARRQDLSDLPKLDRLRIEATDLEITREYQAAAAKFEEMAHAGAADVAVDLGRAFEHAGQPDAAIRSYRSAAEAPEPNPAAWLRLGVLYARQSHRAPSEKAFAEAERLYQLTSNLEGLTEVALQEGIAANSRGELEDGAAHLRKALATAQMAGNVQQEINAKLRLSTNAYMAGDVAETERYAREALDTSRSHQLDVMAIRGLINLGNASNRKQDFARAEQYYREALGLARQGRVGWLTASSLLSLAGLHDQMSDHKQAVEEAREALAFYQTNHYSKESLQSLTVIARAQRDSGDYEGALQSFHSLLDSAEKSQDRLQMALGHESIGAVLLKQTRYPEALEEYSKSLEFASGAEQSGYARVGCANALWRLGRYAEAGEMFQKADAIAEKFARLRVLVVSGRAWMSLSQGRYREALDASKRGLAMDGGRSARLQAEFGDVTGLAMLRGGNKRDGLKKCEEVWSAASADRDLVDWALAGIAVLEARLGGGERDKALQVFAEIEPRLSGFPELEWRALALASGVDASYAGRAQEALLRISDKWGQSVYNVYLARPDVDKLARPILRPAPAARQGR